VRPITPELLGLFSEKNNRLWLELGAANSPLALYHDVDFEVTNTHYVLDEPYASEFRNVILRQEVLGSLMRKYNNVVVEIHITRAVIKAGA
jgi:hypothetical protein